jgi:2-amino-4-hydroxy-6-hydroxymethyldihydropteridine diphosphokinase
MQDAVRHLNNFPATRILNLSSIYLTEASGLKEENSEQFMNMVCLLETELSPFVLFDLCEYVESLSKRAKNTKGHYLSRELDLDILFYEDRIINSSVLQIPHPRLSQRDYVLLPLAEIIGKTWKNPLNGLSLKSMIEKFYLQNLPQTIKGKLPYKIKLS